MSVTATQLAEFDEATSFERYAIETSIATHANTTNTSSVDLRSTPGHIAFSGGVSVALGFTENLSAGAVSATISNLRPLIFGAAFKVVDIMLELALDAAGLTPANGRRWRIDEKVGRARSADGDLTPLTDSMPDAWQRVCALYAGWEDVRHSLVHRTARVDTSTGELVGHDRSGNALTPVSATDQEQFARLAVEFADVVIAGDASARTRKQLAWRLNELRTHHQLPDLADATQPDMVPSVIASLEQLPSGLWRLDAKSILDRARAVLLQATEFNGEFHALAEGHDRVFHCNLEEAPATTDFALDSPPGWLHEAELFATELA